jgi:hypothetical protein
MSREFMNPLPTHIIYFAQSATLVPPGNCQGRMHPITLATMAEVMDATALHFSINREEFIESDFLDKNSPIVCADGQLELAKIDQFGRMIFRERLFQVEINEKVAEELRKTLRKKGLAPKLVLRDESSTVNYGTEQHVFAIEEDISPDDVLHRPIILVDPRNHLGNQRVKPGNLLKFSNNRYLTCSVIGNIVYPHPLVPEQNLGQQETFRVRVWALKNPSAEAVA